MPETRWLPLVWGRTRRADRWWRVLPEGLDPDGWAAEVVAAVFAGGVGLQEPRFLLARLHGWWVTGVACSAGDLDASMAMDRHKRPLSTFVGWMTDADRRPALPTLADWEADYVSWAAPAYTRWCRPDWDRHPADVGSPAVATPDVVGWSGRPPPGDSANPITRDPGRLHLHPAAERHALWTAGAMADVPFVLAIGWADRQVLDPGKLTHAAVTDLAERLELGTGGAGPDLGEPAPSAELAELGAGGRETARDAVDAEPIDPGNGAVAEPGGRRGLLAKLADIRHLGRIDALEHDVAALRAELGATRDDVAELRAQLGRLAAGTVRDPAADDSLP